MSGAAAMPLNRDEENGPLREFGLWAGAAAVVVAAHIGIAASFMAFQSEPESGGAPDTAIMVDLAPMTTSIDAPQLDEQSDIDEIKAPETPPEPLEEEPELVEPLEPPPLEPLPEPVIELPEPEVVTPKPEAVLPVAKPKPEPKPEPEKKVERQKPVKKPRAEANRVRSAAEAPRAERSAAAEASRSVASRASPATWHSRVAAYLARYKTRGAGRGTIRLTLTVDSRGNITSSNVQSGNAILERAVRDMVRRAGRVPAPPADLGITSYTFTMPVVFK